MSFPLLPPFPGDLLGSWIPAEGLGEDSGPRRARTHPCTPTTRACSSCTAVVLAPAGALPFPDYTIQHRQQCVWTPPLTRTPASRTSPPASSTSKRRVPHPNHRHFPNRCLRPGAPTPTPTPPLAADPSRVGLVDVREARRSGPVSQESFGIQTTAIHMLGNKGLTGSQTPPHCSS